MEKSYVCICSIQSLGQNSAILGIYSENTLLLRVYGNLTLMQEQLKNEMIQGTYRHRNARRHPVMVTASYLWHTWHNWLAFETLTGTGFCSSVSLYRKNPIKQRLLSEENI